MQTHFTFTGMWAGKTYCGEPRNDKDIYMHIKGENTPIMQQLLNGEKPLCPKCKEIYNH